MKKLDTKAFIEKARKMHGDKYDYSKVEYKDAKTKVCIICPIHGEFWQIPYNHLSGKGCFLCGRLINKLKNTHFVEEFVTKARKVHGDKYDYSKVEYKDAKTKVCIICPIHGEFWQRPSDHLKGKNCQECSRQIYNKNPKTLSLSAFIEKARKVHGDKYDYSKVEYKNNSTKVCIICPIHGEFWQRPSDHLKGKNCRSCHMDKLKKNHTLTTEDFIAKARKVHGDKYDYSKVVYKAAKEKVCIICPEHGEFWQTPDSHTQGYGCSVCSKTQNAKEILLFNLLNYYFKNEEIIYQAHINWLGRQSFDFYFPKYNLAIEYQGIQHFSPVSFLGGENGFKETRLRDIKKYELAKQHQVTIIYFSFVAYPDLGDFPYNVIFDEELLIKKIKHFFSN